MSILSFWIDLTTFTVYINDLTNIDENTRLTNTIQRQSYITVSGTPFYGSHVGNVQI